MLLHNAVQIVVVYIYTHINVSLWITHKLYSCNPSGIHNIINIHKFKNQNFIELSIIFVVPKNLHTKFERNQTGNFEDLWKLQN